MKQAYNRREGKSTPYSHWQSQTSTIQEEHRPDQAHKPTANHKPPSRGHKQEGHPNDWPQRAASMRRQQASTTEEDIIKNRYSKP